MEGCKRFGFNPVAIPESGKLSFPDEFFGYCILLIRD
jgi:hypothetical protein